MSVLAVPMLAAGSDLYTVSKLPGHSDIHSTQVYANVVMETKIKAVSRISEYFQRDIAFQSQISTPNCHNSTDYN